MSANRGPRGNSADRVWVSPTVKCHTRGDGEPAWRAGVQKHIHHYPSGHQESGLAHPSRRRTRDEIRHIPLLPYREYADSRHAPQRRYAHSGDWPQPSLDSALPLLRQRLDHHHPSFPGLRLLKGQLYFIPRLIYQQFLRRTFRANMLPIDCQERITHRTGNPCPVSGEVTSPSKGSPCTMRAMR